MASPDILALDSEAAFLGHYASDNYARENFRGTSVWLANPSDDLLIRTGLIKTMFEK